MATRYWVGGTGDWTDTAHWSTSSGGSGGASAPDFPDAAIFDASSGGGTVTAGSGQSCLTLTTTGFTGSLSLSVTAYGNVTLGSTATHTSLELTFSTSATLTTNSETISSLEVIAGGDVVMAAALTTGAITLAGGWLRLKNGVTSTCTSFSSSSSAALASTSAGSQATLSDSSGTNTLTSITVQDIAFTGGAKWAARSGYVDGGHNTGVTSSSVPILFFGGEA